MPLFLPVLVNFGLGLAMAIFSQSTVISISLYFIIPSVTVVLTQISYITELASWISLGHSSSVFVAGLVPQTNMQILVSVVFWVLLPLSISIFKINKQDIS